MENANARIAREIAGVACEYEQKKTGNSPKSITVVLGENALVITLRRALSTAELVLAKSPAGAVQVQEFHRQLFENSADSLRQEIKRIIGVDVREAAVEVEPASGSIVKAFATRNGRGGVSAGREPCWGHVGGCRPEPNEATSKNAPLCTRLLIDAQGTCPRDVLKTQDCRASVGRPVKLPMHTSLKSAAV